MGGPHEMFMPGGFPGLVPPPPMSGVESIPYDLIGRGAPSPTRQQSTTSQGYMPPPQFYPM